jgi:phenylethanolamine N-methyltransferase
MSAEQFVGRFDAFDYLDEYYPDDDIGPENIELLDFYHAACQEISGRTWLEIGGGPTLYQLISASTRVRSILFTEYLEANLAAVRLWLKSDRPGRWRNYIKATLRLEGLLEPSETDIRKRAQLIRGKVKGLRHINIKDPSSLAGFEQGFEIVNSSFCIDSITDDRAEWQTLLGRLNSSLKPGGSLILCSLGASSSYQVKDRDFPAVDLSEEFILASLASLNYDVAGALVRVIEAEDSHGPSYGNLICVKAVKL